jgi:hypothetical protein
VCSGAGVFLSASSLTYPLRFAQSPFCQPSATPPHFRHYLIKDTIFGKSLLNVKRVFSFSLQLLLETFLILRRN